MEMELASTEDWIAARAYALNELSLNFDTLEDEEVRSFMRQMMKKIVDSVVMPEGHNVTKLKLVEPKEKPV